VVPADERCKGASPELGRAIARMMARRPRDRFPTMEAAAHALRVCIGSQPQQASFAKVLRTAPDIAPAEKSRSDAPTAIVDMAEPVSAEREIEGQAQLQGARPLAKGATMPLAVPLKAAVGNQAAAQLANGAAASGAAGLNRTLPLARPNTQHPSIPVRSDPGSDPSVATSARPPSNPSLPGAPSGVYASRSQAEAAARARSEARSTTGGTQQGRAREARSSAPRLWLVLVVLVVAAVAGSGVAAWLLR
jgi:hypothetical protein